MSRVPKGYVELTRSTDGKTFIVDARGLCVFPPAVEDAARKTCGVASVYYDDGGWIVTESFDEICAKLAAALGEQDAPKPVAPARDVEPEEMVHHAQQLETARRGLLNVTLLEPVRQAMCSMENAAGVLRRLARGGA